MLGFACAGGIASALWMSGLVGSHRPQLATSVNIKNWNSDWSIGTKGATPYMRSYVAKHGLLGLPKSEAVYFIRTVDDDGNTLTENCSYRINGGGQMAKWWSITLYDGNDLLPRNDDNAYSIDQTQMGDGLWTADIQSFAPKTTLPWLSTRNAGTFDLMLRLYKPKDSLLKSPNKSLNPPSITRTGCTGANE